MPKYDPARLPDPLALTCCFTARDGRVVRLIIIHNEATLAWAPALRDMPGGKDGQCR